MLIDRRRLTLSRVPKLLPHKGQLTLHGPFEVSGGSVSPGEGKLLWFAPPGASMPDGVQFAEVEIINSGDFGVTADRVEVTNTPAVEPEVLPEEQREEEPKEIIVPSVVQEEVASRPAKPTPQPAARADDSDSNLMLLVALVGGGSGFAGAFLGALMVAILMRRSRKAEH